jgi:hypothetical protein
MKLFLKLSFTFFVLALVLALAQAPAAPVAAPSSGGVWDVLTDPNNLAPAAFLLSNIADAKTDWHFSGPFTHKDYVITPSQRLGIAGGSIFVAYTIRHYYPRAAKPINVVMAIATAYFAGRAYANTFNHGVVATPISASPPFAIAASKSTAFGFSGRF